MKILLIIPVLALSGCFAGVETRSGWHMVSLPPSSGKRLQHRCSGGGFIAEPQQTTLNLVSELCDKREEKFKNIIRDLEMENAALKAANKHLLEQEHGK